MRRKIYDKLLQWKQGNGKSALLIKGARRVGKSYIVEEFAKKEYKTYILIDFNKAGKEVKDLFEYYLDDLNTFFLYLSSIYNVKLYPRETLIILDEVQLFPRARSAIKYLVEHGQYDYIETGSLISIKKNVKDILIPSEEDHVEMYPLDFEEFLWALGNDTMMDLLRDCFAHQRPLGQALHRKAMNYLRQYIIIGGMPQAVNSFVESNDFNEVDKTKRRILNLYRDDIRKHADDYALEVEAIFDEIPSQLKNQNQHFKLSSIKQGARFKEYKDAIFWLADAMIANNCFNATEPNLGLRLNIDKRLLKCYMADTGLLISHAFDENNLVSEEIYKKLLFDKLEFNKGMIVENIVAQMLVATGHKLYFYANTSREEAASRMEIDFLIAKSKISNRRKISRIEVRSGKNYALASIKKFMTKYEEQLYVPYVLHSSDLKVEDGIVYLPLYMTPLL